MPKPARTTTAKPATRGRARRGGPGRGVVFFGSTALGHRCCSALLERGVRVAGIVTLPERFGISYAPSGVRNVTHRSFDDLARCYRVPLHTMTGTMRDPALHAALTSWHADLGLVIGWYHLVPASVRALFPLGVAGVHASMLPLYRGGAPLVWAIIRGETSTGVSLFYLEDGVDTGDIVAQRRVRIGADDTIKHVYERATSASVRLVRDYVPRILDRSAPRRPQDHARATIFPQRSPSDGLIDWTQSPQRIRDFIRAQTRPYPGAFTIIEGKKVTLWDADIAQHEPPGNARG